MILSIDVGIANLSYCLYDEETKNIVKWAVVDLFPTPPTAECAGFCKNGSPCGRKSRFAIKDKHYCGTHLPKGVPKACPDLYRYVQKKTVSRPKIKMIMERHNCTKEEQLENVDVAFETDKLIARKQKTPSLVDICIRIRETFEQEIKQYDFSTVLIENQLGMSAIGMKSVQSAITMYFVMINKKEIVYVSPRNKLKGYNTPQSTYKERKASAISITRERLKATNSPHLLAFENSRKKDDLADSYLQAMWYIGSKAMRCRTV